MNNKIKPIIDQATQNLRVRQLYDQTGMTWDMQWDKLAEKAEGKGISVVPYIITGSGQYLMPEFNRYEFAKLIIKECAEIVSCNGHVSGFALGDLIKEHFGVEE
jgi:hypothetical protein